MPGPKKGEKQNRGKLKRDDSASESPSSAPTATTGPNSRYGVSDEDEDDAYQDDNLLIVAIKQGDVKAIREQLSRGVDVNKPVTWRSESQNMISQHLEPTLESSPGYTSNLQMSSPSKPGGRKSLIGKRWDHDINPDINSVLPIHLAAMRSWSATNFLLDSGAKIDKTDAFARTALQRAIFNGRGEGILNIVQLLISRGANINAPPGASGTALEAAIRERKDDVFHLLLDAGADVNQVDDGYYGTPLTTAVDCNSQAVRILLDRGANPNVSGSHGRGSALYSTALWNRVEMAKWLLEAGAKADGVPDRDKGVIGLPPLVTAAENGNFEMIKLLLSHGANIDAIDRRDLSSVAAAALYDHLDVALWLLKHGADASIAVQTFHKFSNNSSPPEEMPEVLKAWEHATNPPEYETVEALFGSIPFSPSKRRCLVTKYQWELPKFIDEYGYDRVSDMELMLTSTTSHNADKLDETPHLRALTWGDLVESQTRQFPEIGFFLQALVRKAAQNPGAVSSGSLNYTHEFDEPKSSVRVKCSQDNIDVVFDNDIPEAFHTELLWNLEVVCKSFRPTQESGNIILSKAVWKLERYQIAPEDLSADDPGPVFDLRLAARLSSQELEIKQHTCWQTLLVGGWNVVDLGSRGSESLDSRSRHSDRPVFGKGLEMSFQMMIALAAVEFHLVVYGGVVLVGYETALVPIEIIGDVAQFHLLTRDDTAPGQLNPYTMDLGSRLKTEDVQQFRNKRCFLGWCEFAQINLGTSNLLARVNYSGGREKSQSVPLDGVTVVSGLGVPAGPLSALLGLEANFKRTSHRLHFTPISSYAKLLRDTALEVTMVYDSGEKRCWLVPKLSLLLHMCQAYVVNSGVGGSCNGVPSVQPHGDAVELISTLEPMGDRPVLDVPGDGLLFRQLLLGLNTNLLATVPLIRKSERGKLYGFEFMDVVTSPGRGSVMKELDVPTIGKYWLGMVNAVDAVLVCSNIGDVITAASGTTPASGYRSSTACNSLPEGNNYLAATTSCLARLVHRKGGELCTGGVPGLTSGQSSSNGVHGINRIFEGFKISDDRFWNIEGDPFRPCAHDGSSADTCWTGADLLQRLATPSHLILTRIRWKKLTPAMPKVPVSGAVAFGRFVS